MLVIGDILISDDLLDSYFHCNLQACLGACCEEGDFGAPLEKEELIILDEIQEKLYPFLNNESIQLLRINGGYCFYDEPNTFGTRMQKDGACVYMVKNEAGINLCGIEVAWKAGCIEFQKPISCHLYPVRRKTNEISGFEALNYDVWHICNPACTLGQELKLPLYSFVQNALIRLYGTEFFNELEAAAQHMATGKNIIEKEDDTPPN
ncbi:MAG TPA: DUF3109 family protein [Saprospiraceae bacterium]|nr:DUF3109 family protein [Saprospiraceae bacterium]